MFQPGGENEKYTKLGACLSKNAHSNGSIIFLKIKQTHNIKILHVHLSLWTVYFFLFLFFLLIIFDINLTRE